MDYATSLNTDFPPWMKSANHHQTHPDDAADFHTKSASGGEAAAAATFPFTGAQWKELERQAMIYKCMISCVPVPPHLLVNLFPLNGGRYGRKGDPEPGRCKRTDGKKWRCSREVAPLQKYCERHLHRGRPRSRKPVESNNIAANHKKTRLHPPPPKPTTISDCLLQSPNPPPEENPTLCFSHDYDYPLPLNLFGYPEIELPNWSIDSDLSMAVALDQQMRNIRSCDCDRSVSAFAMGGPLGEALAMSPSPSRRSVFSDGSV
ncbi:hypothetical protein AAHA92_07700 [Salvia divinorum]|uniref:Growth-regulating factor n=1 Tax=Salvia divinorum TaxID=28513 RepID=A0ABD1I9V6_SALDI